MTRAESVAALAARVAAARAGGAAELFCLVNNAGIGTGGNVDWTPLDVYRRVLDVNFLGLVAVTKALLGALQDDAAAAMAARAPPPRVVNIASIAGLIAAPGMSAYAASSTYPRKKPRPPPRYTRHRTLAPNSASTAARTL